MNHNLIKPLPTRRPIQTRPTPPTPIPGELILRIRRRRVPLQSPLPASTFDRHIIRVDVEVRAPHGAREAATVCAVAESKAVIEDGAWVGDRDAHGGAEAGAREHR